MPSNPLLENNVQELLYVETHAEYSAGSGIDITNNVISLDPSVSAAIDNKLDTSSFSSYSATIDDELQYVSANAGKTYSGIAPIVVNNDTNEISAETIQLSAGDNITLTEEGNIVRIDGQAGGLTGDYISGSNVTGFSLQNHLGEPYNQGYDIHFTTDAIAGMYLSEYDSASSHQLYLDPEKLMFVENYGTPDQRNETFDANDISALKNTSGNWNEVSAISSTSSVLNNQITAVRNDLNTVSSNTGYLYNDLQTTSGILSAAIDDISANMPEGFTGVNHDNNLSGDGKSIPLGLASSIKLQDPSIYTTATYGGSVSIEGIMPRIQLKTNNSSYNTLGEGGMTVTHPASSVGGGYTTCHYGEKMSLSYNDGDYYLHTVDTTKSGLGVTYKGASNVKAYYNYSGVALTNDNGATNEYVNVDSIRKWNSVYNDVSTASGGWGGGTSLTGDAQGAVDEVYSNSANWSDISAYQSNSANYMTNLFIAKYGQSTYAEVEDAVTSNKIVYCQATPNGATTRMAFLAYVGTNNYEFQYYRSVNSHSFSNQGDEVYIYTCNRTGTTWTSSMRNAYTQISASKGLSGYYTNGTYRLAATGAATTGDLNTVSSILSGAIDYISGNAGTTYTGVAPIVVTGNTISADSFDLAIGSGLAFENNTLYVSAQAGDPEVENYVQTNSATIDDTVTNVTTNSGAWGGSALPISAGPGIKLEMVNNTLVASTDETVLFSGSLEQLGSTGQLSEPISRFDRIKLLVKLNRSTNDASEWFEFNTDKTNFGMCGALSNNAGSSAGNGYIGWMMASIDGTTLTYTNHYQWMMSYTAFSTATHTANGSIMQVIGINRINNI